MITEINSPAGIGCSAATCYASACGRVTLYLGDCRDIAPTLPAGSCDLLLAAPPYGMGKEKDGVMNDNLYGAKLDAFLIECWAACRPALKDNASTYIWGNAPDLARLWWKSGLGESERLSLRNHIVWDKKSIAGMASDLLTQYPTASEHCLFFQIGEQFIGSINADDFPESWEPLRQYLKTEADAAGIEGGDIQNVCGCGMYSHWFTRSQFTLIPEKHYQKLAEAYPGRFARPWESLKAEWDRVKGGPTSEIQGARSYFDNAHSIMRDVWEFPRVTGADRFGHATPKPVAMMGRCIKTSCPPGGTVLDPFTGTAPTAIACIRTGRKFIGIEKDPTHYATAVERITNELAQGDLFLGHNDKDQATRQGHAANTQHVE